MCVVGSQVSEENNELKRTADNSHPKRREREREREKAQCAHKKALRKQKHGHAHSSVVQHPCTDTCVGPCVKLITFHTNIYHIGMRGQLRTTVCLLVLSCLCAKAIRTVTLRPAFLQSFHTVNKLKYSFLAGDWHIIFLPAWHQRCIRIFRNPCLQGVHGLFEIPHSLQRVRRLLCSQIRP